MNKIHSASNALYNGELDGDPLSALNAICEEYQTEAAISRSYGEDDFSVRLEASASVFRAYASRLQELIQEAASKLADEIEANPKDALDVEIVASLRSGMWHNCAI